MNEQDTFNRLRRPTLTEMTVLVGEFYRQNSHAGPVECEPLLLANNWTLKEYTEQYNNKVGQLMRGLDIISD